MVDGRLGTVFAVIIAKQLYGGLGQTRLIRQ